MPNVSIVSMLAPSPDWFVGASDLPLCVDGKWRDEVAVDLVVFDAGTDSGATFTSPDQDTQPADAITLQELFVENGQPVVVGTMSFQRL